MAVVGVGVAPVGVGCGGATPPKERDSGEPFGVQTARRRIGIGAECWRGVRDSAPSRECRPGGWHPLRPQRYRRAIGPGRIGPQAVLPPIFLDAPGLFGDSAAADERIGVKNPPRTGLRGGGRRPNPDTIRTGSVTAPRFRSRGTSFAVRVALPYSIPPTGLERVCSSREAFGFASTGPENLRPSTRHRDLHRPIHTDISTTIKQHNILGKHDPK